MVINEGCKRLLTCEFRYDGITRGASRLRVLYFDDEDVRWSGLLSSEGSNLIGVYWNILNSADELSKRSDSCIGRFVQRLTRGMAVVKPISWLVYALFMFNHEVFGLPSNKNHDLRLILEYRKVIENKIKSTPCTEDFNLLGMESILQDYSFWNNEIRTVNQVANYLTSMWRYKDKRNRSILENAPAIYTLAQTIALSSKKIFGSVVCFDEGKFQGKRQFCPYAFKNDTEKNHSVVRDLGRHTDYLTKPTSHPTESFLKYTFVWWHVGRQYLSNVAKLRQRTAYFDINMDNPGNESQNIFPWGRYYNITSSYIPIQYGRWTTPYYDCFGGKTWMITYLAPFYNEHNEFLWVFSDRQIVRQKFGSGLPNQDVLLQLVTY